MKELIAVLLQEEALLLLFYHPSVKLIKSCPTVFPKLMQHFGMTLKQDTYNPNANLECFKQ